MTSIRCIDGSLTGEKYKPGVVFDFRLAIPCADTEAFAILIEHDGQIDANVNALLRLADAGKAPYCVSIGVVAGRLRYPDGTERYMRMNSYDWFDREYGDFIVHELIPHVAKTYGLKFSESPDMHMVSGGSSGGVSAFVVAWFHPDYFHRVYLSSPSYIALGRGNEIPYLVRKYEPKPLRIYNEYSEHEPNDYFGWSRAIDAEAGAAFKYAGYESKTRYFPGEGHSSRYRDEEEAVRRMEWLWRDWDKEPVTVKRMSPRVSAIIPSANAWERCDAFPEVPEAEVPAELKAIYSHIVLSNDGKVWYAARQYDDWIEMIVNETPLRPERALAQGALHTIPRQKQKGVIDMVTDKCDRLFVLTGAGVQCVRSFGLIDAILSLPDDGCPERIAITDALYVKTDQGCYRRELRDECVLESEQKRKHVDYYD
ncbi:MAG: hypothetical protein J5950_09285 [Clostridia bacterium]|nr:hypothetical protein [Clostridia bacterium]